jgi:nitrogen fixation/metabolism regulation signal transduction histidine kinase
MPSQRTRLIGAFVLATLLPLGATIWIATSLIERSLGYGHIAELDRVSRTLEGTARQFYQRERDALRQDATAGRTPPSTFALADLPAWPDAVREFRESGEPERFLLSGTAGDHLDFMQKDGHGGVVLYRRDLGGLRMDELSAEFRRTRELVQATESQDLRRGFTLTFFLLIAIVWLVSLAPLIYLAHRISRPIQQLTAGLTDFAAGDWDRRINAGGGGGDDEVGRAVEAFNHMAEQIRRNRDRLVYLTQMSSWQSLARKTAHELKNSLTPIRLTVEEMLARQPLSDRAFMEQAAQIVVTEIETLERRVRAFSEFAREPDATTETIDVNALVSDRVALLQPAHPATSYQVRFDHRRPLARASGDLLKGILTNLLENAADAAGAGGHVLTVTRREPDRIILEVHDSGPGVNAEAAATLFEPTITFKKHGMGLGLLIARKNALLCGGDITLVRGELAGAAFRVVLPAAAPQA